MHELRWKIDYDYKGGRMSEDENGFTEYSTLVIDLISLVWFLDCSSNYCSCITFDGHLIIHNNKTSTKSPIGSIERCHMITIIDTRIKKKLNMNNIPNPLCALFSPVSTTDNLMLTTNKWILIPFSKRMEKKTGRRIQNIHYISSRIISHLKIHTHTEYGHEQNRILFFLLGHLMTISTFIWLLSLVKGFTILNSEQNSHRSVCTRK